MRSTHNKTFALSLIVAAALAGCGGGSDNNSQPTQASQSIALSAPGDQVMGNATPALSATSNAGLAVTLSSKTPTVCTVSGTALTIVATGTCTVQADQAGDSTHKSATSSTSFTVYSHGTVVTKAQMNDQDLNDILLNAQDGDAIVMPAGAYPMAGPLQITGKNNITLAGAGNGKDPATSTILSFKKALVQNGLSTSTLTNATFRKFAIEDASGNALFVTSSQGVVMDTVRAEWTVDPEGTSTMAYGLYPVRSDNILVTNSIVVGSRDAGVYVGQSTNITVSNNDVHNNVAGVEIENSHNAIVDGNNVHQNTGGILVFALPGPTRFLDTTDVVVRNNSVVDNNVPPAVNAQGLVLTIPPGTGVMVLASQNVEVAGNTITNHKTTGVLITSTIAAGIPFNPATKDEQGKGYDPFERGVYVHDNHIADFGASPGGAFADPTTLGPFTQGFFATMGAMAQPKVFPAVIWDGIVDPYTGTGQKADGSGGNYPANKRICSVHNDVTAPLAGSGYFSFENLDLDLAAVEHGGSPQFPMPTRMICTDTLPAVTGNS
jgi:parallel beta-helix repeat protein